MPPRRLDAPDELAWLGAEEENGWCGYHRTGWESTTWVLHAAYQRIDVPEGGPPVVSGAGYEANRHPGYGWERVLWRDCYDDPATFECRYPPSFHWAKHRDFATFIAPEEGTLDHDSFVTLVGLLAAASPDGGATECFAYFGGGTSDHYSVVVWRCRLDELVGVARRVTGDRTDDGEPGWYYSPSNFWPVDRSWLVYTDYDLMGTEVSGSAELIAAVERSPALETIRWAWPATT
ncbi:hypothetical protein [Tsukamurella pseudospumae]|uniref:DUF317 domain-containing protein n=1 Tax=Tsukamurella pseudospumae TaxID=239498 RepID=A0A137YSM8_9ACTN|nr:hypothetical protein [Tsukamurella pseudospumae]KXO88887.1 hypothetical protein AXK61_09535 [Tsukamurella pseudospumae]